MHHIKDGSAKKAVENENVFDVEITEEIENPFSYTLMLRPKNIDCKANIGWEIEKEKRKELDIHNLRIEIPKEELLFLK